MGYFIFTRVTVLLTDLKAESTRFSSPYFLFCSSSAYSSLLHLALGAVTIVSHMNCSLYICSSLPYVIL